MRNFCLKESDQFIKTWKSRCVASCPSKIAEQFENNSKLHPSPPMQKPDCRLKSDRTSGTEERGTVARKREWPTLDRLVAQFRRPTREKVYYTLAQPSSNVVFFFHSVSGARLGGQRLPPSTPLFLRSVLSLVAPSSFRSPHRSHVAWAPSV